MLIGVDYPKFEFELFHLKLLEPNAFIGDALIFIFSFIFFVKVSSLNKENPSEFLKNWKRFFIWFGITFLLGGFGHLLYNYTGIYGKIPSWFTGLLSPFYIERAMISIYPDEGKRIRFYKLSSIKLILFFVIEIIMLSLFDIAGKPELGLIPPTLSSTLGLVICLAVLGSYYQKQIHSSFKYLFYSVFILLFSAIPQVLKINPFQLFDRNDISHFLLILSLFLYYQTIKENKKFLL